MSGQILGDRYEVEKQIGKQTGRWTLLARDLQTQERVVIKLLFLADQLDSDDLKLFEREVEVLKSLSHPLIPRYLGFFEQALPNDRALALIQTYVEGRSLEDCIQQGRIFTEAETRQLAKAMLSILVYLHGCKPPVIHRDIKPSNILLANRQVHLVDFGSVKTFKGNETTGFTVVGTYGYMPPEQFSGRAIPASDLFSLGATLVALLTGTHPSSLPRRGVKLDTSRIPNLTPEFADWLDWLVDPNLDKRVKSAQEALATVDQGRPVAPTAIQTLPKPPNTKITVMKDARSLEVTVPSTLGQTQLTIDSQQISLSTRRLGLSAGRPVTSPRHTIKRVERSKALKAGDNPQLIIWAEQKYELGTTPPLTEAEVEWLATEVANWLKMPIS